MGFLKYLSNALNLNESYITKESRDLQERGRQIHEILADYKKNPDRYIKTGDEFPILKEEYSNNKSIADKVNSINSDKHLLKQKNYDIPKNSYASPSAACVDLSGRLVVF